MSGGGEEGANPRRSKNDEAAIVKAVCRIVLYVCNPHCTAAVGRESNPDEVQSIFLFIKMVLLSFSAIPATGRKAGRHLVCSDTLGPGILLQGRAAQMEC